MVDIFNGKCRAAKFLENGGDNKHRNNYRGSTEGEGFQQVFHPSGSEVFKKHTDTNEQQNYSTPHFGTQFLGKAIAEFQTQRQTNDGHYKRHQEYNGERVTERRDSVVTHAGERDTNSQGIDACGNSNCRNCH